MNANIDRLTKTGSWAWSEEFLADLFTCTASESKKYAKTSEIEIGGSKGRLWGSHLHRAKRDVVESLHFLFLRLA